MNRGERSGAYATLSVSFYYERPFSFSSFFKFDLYFFFTFRLSAFVSG